MAKVFGMGAPKVPTSQTPDVPRADEQQIRDAKLKQVAELDRSSGPAANALTESKLGDYSKAATRSGALPPSQIVSAKAA
jgi:hypothetical protein